MGTDIEKLPRLIERAAAALARATTAAEILDARDQADLVYTAAKAAARMGKVKDAHDTVQAACRKMMADALIIETQAACRLADEYDAAQERGEVQKRGGNHTSKVLNENFAPTLASIGLDKKQVHEARAVRDAEKAKPGVVRKAVEKKLAAGEEPTRADVKRAVKGERPSGKANAASKPRAARSPKAVEREEKVASLRDAGLSAPEIAEKVGLGLRAVHQALEHVDIKREAVPDIDPATLALSAQEKLAAALRQHQRKLDAEFERRVRDDIRKGMDELVLPHWREKIEQAKTLYGRRKGLMDKDTFNMIRRALHPDSRNAISDKKLAEAFDAFMRLEKFLLDEKASPTEFPDLPDTYEGWMKMRQTRSTKKQGRSNIRPR